MDLEQLLNELVSDDDGEWPSCDMGNSRSFYSTFDRELKTMAKERGLQIETDREAQHLYAMITARKSK